MTTHVRTDAEIQRHVLDGLQWEPMLKATDVGVEVNDGIVTLTGTVRSWAEREEAEAAAWRARSVTRVTNRIDLRPEPPLPLRRGLGPKPPAGPPPLAGPKPPAPHDRRPRPGPQA